MHSPSSQKQQLRKLAVSCSKICSTCLASSACDTPRKAQASRGQCVGRKSPGPFAKRNWSRNLAKVWRNRGPSSFVSRSSGIMQRKGSCFSLSHSNREIIFDEKSCCKTIVSNLFEHLLRDKTVYQHQHICTLLNQTEYAQTA